MSPHSDSQDNSTAAASGTASENVDILRLQQENDELRKNNSLMKESLKEEHKEKENLNKQLSYRLTEIDELKAESENCFGREKNSLMILSGFENKTELLSYVLKPDGSQNSVEIKMPFSGHKYHYLNSSIYALIRGKVYIFGGYYKGYELRIAMISGCEIKELESKLNSHFTYNSAAVTAADQQSAMICFPRDDEWRSCEEFDGTDVSIKPATKYSHKGSCLALYNNKPVTVSSSLSDGYKKVEKFDGVSWIELEDFPSAIYFHSCIGVFDGYLLFGAKYKNNGKYGNSKDVYLLRDSKWTVVGKLNEFHSYSTATRIGNTIYLVSGRNQRSHIYAVEKLEWDGEKISSAKVIKNHSKEFIRPIVFPVDEFYCT
ncbi:Oidioi.mRNA.OKI2018_I69.chr1.g3768.t1.cds [Oikopleura dioica]|uniref:Oidioi.mRNA.OKI2018_I69.chr1.g3768.t1.cds n=1 Tax=Oikopleura dioica TaxID=34765 RepID=A0ABN7SV86_OIKDI|nr:Oidioi.mRNA.OKI2018_I69.chr1.g3768.t1.cds [Oikopleura dioica]